MARNLSLGSDQDQKDRYLRAVAKFGTLTSGCRAARCSPHTVYKWREHDQAFSIRELEVRNEFADSLEIEARRRAFAGSDRLLEMLLRAVRPEKYRERLDITRTEEPSPKVYASVGPEDL